jgi:hypothetical protein
MTEIDKEVLKMLQVSLADYKLTTGLPPTRELLMERIGEITHIKRYSDIDQHWILAQLEQLFTIWTEPPKVLFNNDGHEPWLLKKKAEIDWKFWNRYSMYLTIDAHLSPAAIENIDVVSNNILENIEDPARPGPWDRRGLIMGNVQSGKTGTYTGLISKAADAGYKVIIVLAGLHNNLRCQTQIRLDDGFLGYKANAPGNGGFLPTGVYKYDSTPKADSITNRNENGDFRGTVASQFGIQPGGNPLLFVVKKNVTILNNLLSWIHGLAPYEDHETGRKFHRDVPLLIIDDEADQASIDVNAVSVDEFGNRNEEHNPTKINASIRKLLFAFDKSAYVGFTATPFANIFIHEENSTKKLGPDLFPRSFIINLPAPSNYYGAAQIFGVEEDFELGIPEIKPIPITKIITDYANSQEPNETLGWMPPKLVDKTDHIPHFDGSPQVPPSLREAILSFILSTVVREFREPQPQFNSMLIHVTRFTKVQQEVRKQVEAEFKKILRSLTFGDGESFPTTLDEMALIWENDFIEISHICGDSYELPNWEYVRENLKRVATSIQIKEINGSAKDALDYESHSKSGINLIAIGGDKLSRGLTLEGLTVSYFLRSSKMYDTLMQMGRWFGYKEKYIDVCRLYTTGELESWFKHIAIASEELRKEFDYMENIGANPKQYGLKVRSHPVMLVTSAMKMRSGTEMKLSYSGDISETVIFNKDQKIINKNFMAASELIKEIKVKSYKKISSSYLWSEIEADLVLRFLHDYKTHDDARRVDTTLLSSYIEKQLPQGELVKWSILLASTIPNSANEFKNCFGDLTLGGIHRSDIEIKNKDTRYTIKRLVDPTHEYADLSEEQMKVALNQTIAYWETSKRKNKSENPPAAPGGIAVRNARDKSNGLLILYPLLDQDNLNGSLNAIPIMGFAISFPKSNTAKEISYTVNNVFQQGGEI